MRQIILASASPRRKEIMDTMGIPYIIITEHVEEVTEETKPDKKVMALAGLKSMAVLDKIREDKNYGDSIIIAADTMVFYQENALGKPKNQEDARQMLSMLSGQVHDVYTGVSIIIRNIEHKEEILSFYAKTQVEVYPLSEKQIETYIHSGEPMDKAGAYAIQGEFGIYIKEIRGDYYNVVGFPIAKINEELLCKGIDLKNLK